MIRPLVVFLLKRREVMKNFYLCKLCLIVFGALLAVQSVSAVN